MDMMKKYKDIRTEGWTEEWIDINIRMGWDVKSRNINVLSFITIKEAKSYKS